ncbi:MAG TPA: hypothetical protein VJN18_25060 [Polyangiaceae bacterium]|nr:hypothetical protein [Polyangiaceae bacterium]
MTRAERIASIKRKLQELRARALRVQNEEFQAARQLEEIEIEVVKLGKEQERDA